MSIELKHLRYAEARKLPQSCGLAHCQAVQSDVLFDPKMTQHQGTILTTMSRWYSNDQIPVMTTST